MSPPLDNTQPSRQAGTSPDAAESQAEVLRENRVRGILAEAGRDVLAAENETTLFERTCKIVRAELLADSSDCLLLSADGAEFRLAAGTAMPAARSSRTHVRSTARPRSRRYCSSACGTATTSSDA